MLRLPIENTLDREEKIMAEWLKTSLIDIVELIGGGTPKTSKAEYWGGNINWLSVKDFNNENRYVYSTEKTITEEGLNNSSTKLLRKDDIIISARGTVGELAMIPFPMAFNQSCYGIRAKDGINSTFLYYLIKHSIRKLKSMTHGSVFDTITRDTFANIEVAIPDIETQQRIAKMLADIDDKVENNQRINNNLLQQLDTLYDEFSHRKNWSTVIINDIAEKVAMGPFGSNIKVSTFVSEGVPIISGNHLRGYFLEEPSFNYITEEHAQRLKNSLVYPKDIVFTHAGNIGQVAMIPDDCRYPMYVLSQRQFYLRCDTEKAIPEYVVLFFHSKQGQHELLSYANQTGVPSIAQPATNLKKIPLKLPPIDEQRQWLQVVSPIIKLYQSNVYENEHLSSMRDSLLPKLMSGELVVSDIDL